MRHIEIDGINLEYEHLDASREGGATLLFLHHGLGSVGLWRDFPERLSRRTGLAALIYSRRGHGGSDPASWPRPVDFMEREALDVVPQLLDGLGVGKVICIGHSEGATSSLVLAASFPERVEAIVVESAHIFVEECNLRAIEETRQTYRTGDLRRRLQRYHADNVDGMFYAWAESWLQPDFATWNIERTVPEIRCRVLAVRGKRDEYVSQAHFERLIGLFDCPVETLVLDCGHAPHEECADEVFDRVAQFIEAGGSPPASP